MKLLGVILFAFAVNYYNVSEIKSTSTYVPPCHEEYRVGDIVDKCFIERD